jgi:dTDP-4-amino-4,6-dideoxygalactose transaminase
VTSATPADERVVRETLAVASGTRPQDWHLVSKARHALLVVLGVLPPGEVVTQPLTCLTAVAPVLTAGHRPRYADLDPATLALDPGLVPALAGGRTRAVVAQHTFGCAAPLQAVRDAAGPEVLLVEDAAHCLGDLARDGSGAPVADVSVHSFGVEKMLPTRAGAAVWTNPDRAGMPWHRPLLAALRGLGPAGSRAALAHRVATPVRRVAGRLGTPGERALSLAADAGLVDLAIMPAERAGRVAGRPSRLDGPALADVLRHLPDLEEVRAHRRRTAGLYRAGLTDVAGLTLPAALQADDLTLVRFPLLLGTAELAAAAFDALAAEGLVPGRWYRPLLFPGPTDPAAFGYRAGSCPRAEDVSARILNLPTAPFVDETAAARSVDVLRRLLGDGPTVG